MHKGIRVIMTMGRPFLVCLLVCLSGALVAEAGDNEKGKKVSVEYELDAYYSNAGLYVNLTDAPIPDAGEKLEVEVYRDLLFSSFIPRNLVVEAAVFPMPALGVFIKKNFDEIYRKGEISGSFNLIRAVTAGFEEPYALSLFLGNVVRFTKSGEEKRQGNFGYMGYLVSFSDRHIKDNELIDDKSYEIEWKIKGDRKFSTHELSWSFRLGAKLHEHPGITDVAYASFRRSRLDYEASSASILNNSGFEYTFDLDRKTGNAVRHYFFVEKKWPWRKKRVAASLALGFIWEGARKYKEGLSDDRAGSEFQFIIRPNFYF